MSIRQGQTIIAGRVNSLPDLSDYALKSEIPTVPTKVSELENDAGYLKSHQDISGKADKSYVDNELSKKADKETTYTKTEVDTLLENTLDVPTKVSELENDAGYLTEHQDISHKADKSDTYTKSEVDAKVSSVYRFKGTVAKYDALPTSDLVVGDVYNIESNGSNYAWDGNDWDKLSETVDLTAYATKEEVNGMLSNIDALPSQEGNEGKVLTTDGTSASWKEEAPAVIFRDWEE